MKQRNVMILGSLVLGSILAFSLYGIGMSMASNRFERDHDDEHEHRYEQSWQSWGNRDRNIQNPLYTEECGSCHMAYPAKFLPPQSWQRIMNGLEDHFGENAELDDVSRKAIADYLTRLAQPVAGQYSRMARNMGNSVPLRITELAHFRHEHDEIPSAYVEGNDKVSSLSQCNACHQNAENGWFDEDNVVIPGVGRWHD